MHNDVSNTRRIIVPTQEEFLFLAVKNCIFLFFQPDLGLFPFFFSLKVIPMPVYHVMCISFLFECCREEERKRQEEKEGCTTQDQIRQEEEKLICK